MNLLIILYLFGQEYDSVEIAFLSTYFQLLMMNNYTKADVVIYSVYSIDFNLVV